MEEIIRQTMRRTMRQLAIRAALCLAILPVSAALPAMAQDTLAGPAKAVDGRSLRIGETVVRLADIDAPDPAQTCMLEDRVYSCGKLARAALADLLTGAQVECRIAVRPPDGPPVAICLADGFDLSLNMVHTGWAVADRDRSNRYAGIESAAREARRGMWRGKFERPSTWRRAVSGE
jgi:endonuclease YncB( thermonuclease family)